MRLSTPALWKPAAILPILALACGGPFQPMQTIPLAGASAGIDKFEGRWFDPEGNLFAVVAPAADSRFNFQLALPAKYFHLEGARLQNDEIVLIMRGGGRSTCSIRLLRANEAAGGCGCMCIFLVRDPSSFWYVKVSTRKATKLACKAYEGAFDWLARVL